MTSKHQNATYIKELKDLVNIIQISLENIESIMKQRELDFPSPHTPLTADTEAARKISEVELACSTIVASATQLVSAVQSPMTTILNWSFSYALPACLGIATLAHAPEICREAGSKGAHVKDIARFTGIDSSKLARILRVLATNYMFIEVSPDVFTNNRLSSCLDTGKSAAELASSPKTKHVGTLGISAGIGHCTDEGLKAMASLQDAVFSPKLRLSEESNEAAFNMTFGTKLPLWDWFEEAGNETRLLRFGMAMQAGKNTRQKKAILNVFDWASLPRDSIVVDVGGGIGSDSLTLAQSYDHLRLVVQDREPVIRDATKFWDDNFPAAIRNGRVTLETHNFFTKQRSRKVSVFLLRAILHDWSDKYCIQILRNLRQAAGSNTHLIIVDNLISYTCVDRSLDSIPGAQTAKPPAPLLPNGGSASTVKYFIDIQMLSLMNGKERTVRQFQELMRKTGWRLVQVHETSVGSASTQAAIAVPM